MNPARRVSFHTLGCRLNQAESALIAEKFRARGWTLAEHGAVVDVAVIHTCTVTERADARCRHEIRKVRKQAPHALVCAIGCLAQSEPETVAALGGVDLVVGNERKYDLPDLVEAYGLARDEGGGVTAAGVEAGTCHDNLGAGNVEGSGAGNVEGSGGGNVAGKVEGAGAGNSAGHSADNVEGSGGETGAGNVEGNSAGNSAAPATRARRPAIHVDIRPDGFRADYPVAGLYTHTTRANLKVQDGCDFVCAYCLLPRVRGRARSRPPDAILAEARELVRRGHRELVVTGVNIGTYRHEAWGLGRVVRALDAIEGVARIRISSIEPTTIEDEVLDWMATSPRACRHLHVPLQSGDDTILETMRRPYRSADYAAFIQRAKARMPDLGLGTDVIVGYPGETEASFQRTVAFLEALPFTYLHVFSFSVRKKTSAARGAEFVDRGVIKARSAALRARAVARKRAFIASHVGQEVEVLLETVDEDGLRKGLTRNYLRVGVPPEAGGENEQVRVRVERVEHDHAVGRVVVRTD